MFSFMGRMMKWTVIGGLLLAGLVSLVGPTRIKTAFWSIRDHLRSNVDELVDTRVALQHEVRKLQKEYPERIADLRVQLREVEKDLLACAKDIRLSGEVVALCESDAEVLQVKIASVDTDADGLPPPLVEFRSERFTRTEALSRAARIAETAQSYRSRAVDLGNEDRLLREEQARLRGELAVLEREYREFQAEVGAMMREIDGLKRKEKLVDLAERRSRDREDLFTDRASSLAVVKERIERRKIELEEKLRGLRSFGSGGNEYEARARLRLAGE